MEMNYIENMGKTLSQISGGNENKGENFIKLVKFAEELGIEFSDCRDLYKDGKIEISFTMDKS